MMCYIFIFFFKFIKEVNIQSLKTMCPSAYKKMNQSVLGNKRMNKSFFLPSRNSKSGKDWARKTTVGELIRRIVQVHVSFSFPPVCLSYIVLFKNTPTTSSGKQKCHQQEISKRPKASGYKLTETPEVGAVPGAPKRVDGLRSTHGGELWNYFWALQPATPISPTGADPPSRWSKAKARSTSARARQVGQHPKLIARKPYVPNIEHFPWTIFLPPHLKSVSVPEFSISFYPFAVAKIPLFPSLSR